MPDHFDIALEPGAVVDSRIVRKQTQRAWCDGQVRDLPVDEERQGQPALGQDEIALIARVGRRLQQQAGYPLEIEWAIQHDGGLALLQARPLQVASG